jgi:hypothetical protein
MYAATRVDPKPISSESGRLSVTELRAGPSTARPSYLLIALFVRITSKPLVAHSGGGGSN